MSLMWSERNISNIVFLLKLVYLFQAILGLIAISAFFDMTIGRLLILTLMILYGLQWRKPWIIQLMLFFKVFAYWAVCTWLQYLLGPILPSQFHTNLFSIIVLV